MGEESKFSEQKVVKVYSTQDELEARMVQELLRNAGIESMITGEVTQSLYPVNMGALGQRDIFVIESTLKEATRIIAEEYQAGEGPGE